MKRQLLPCLCSLLSLPVIITTLSACNSVKIEQINMVNVLDYESKITPTSFDQWMSSEEATQKYIECVQDNPEIFKDDMLCSARVLVENKAKNAYLGQHLSLIEATCGIGTPIFGTTKSWIIGQEDIDYHTISFKLKIHFLYKTPEPSGLSSIIENVDMTFEYKDLIFTLCEDTAAEGGWNIGFFDWNSGKECLWPIIRNINSWSVNYSATFAQTTIMHSQGQRPDIEIHNNFYYSGILDDSVTLNSMMSQISEATSMESLVINLILLGEPDDARPDFSRFFTSHYFNNVIFKPSIRCIDQFHAYNTVGTNTINSIGGLSIILPKSKDGFIFQYDEDKGSHISNNFGNLTFTESSVMPNKRSFVIKPEQKFDINENKLFLNDVTFEGNPYSVDDILVYHSYLLSNNNLSITIHFLLNGQEDSIDIAFPLIYDNLSLELTLV